MRSKQAMLEASPFEGITNRLRDIFLKVEFHKFTVFNCTVCICALFFSPWITVGSDGLTNL